MLVLSRKPGEEIVIGENIRISVLKRQGGRVRLGITAPPAVLISRAEIVGTVAARTLPDTQTEEHDSAFSNTKGDHDVQEVTPSVRPR